MTLSSNQRERGGGFHAASKREIYTAEHITEAMFRRGILANKKGRQFDVRRNPDLIHVCKDKRLRSLLFVVVVVVVVVVVCRYRRKREEWEWKSLIGLTYEREKNTKPKMHRSKHDPSLLRSFFTPTPPFPAVDSGFQFSMLLSTTMALWLSIRYAMRRRQEGRKEEEGRRMG